MADIYNNFTYPVILDDDRDPDVSWSHHLARGSLGGVDLAYPFGSEVLASADGVVSNIPWYGTGGNTVRLRMDDGRYIEYMHLSAFSVNDGTWVPAGARIGLSGSSGNGNPNYYAPHLHVHMYVGTTRVNVFRNFTTPSGLFRQVAGLWTGWQDFSTGLMLQPNVMSSLNMGGAWPETMLAQAGMLYHVTADASAGWRVASTGLPLAAASLSAVRQDSMWPTVMAIEAGNLYQVVRAGDRWVKLWTGLQLIGKISAVYISGPWPVVMLAQHGKLYHIYGDSTGWHVADTKLTVGTDISAVNMGGSLPQVMSAEEGRLYQIWHDGSAWRKGYTGLAANGRISALNMGGVWPQVVLSENNRLHQIFGTTAGWMKWELGIAGSPNISAVNMGGTWPQVHKIG